MAGIYNRLVAAPGQPIALGAQGGVLLLQPPAQIAGQLTLFDMQCRIWHLLREAGPDTGFLPPVVGDYSMAVVQRDLNIWLGRFIGETGLAPDLIDRLVTLPVFAGMDYPVPPDTQSLYGIDYTPHGQQTFPLISANMKEWNAYCADITLSVGQPSAFREPFAGYVRIFPQTGPGQAMGPGIGTVTFNGTPDAGDTVQITITNPPNAPVVVPTYVVLASDTTASIAQAVANLVNASNAVVGASAFLQPCGVSNNSFQLTAINPPGTQITYLTTIAAGEMTVTPNGVATLSPNGDTMTFYYSSTGKWLTYPGDTTQLPPQLQMALVHGLLSEYWPRKGDAAQGAYYLSLYDRAIKTAKELGWNVRRSGPQTIAGFDYDDDFNYRPF